VGAEGAAPAPHRAGSDRREPSVARHRRSKPTDSERDARRNADRARLEEATRELLSSEGWRRWVKTRRSFTATPCLSRGPASSQGSDQAASVDDMSSTVARLGGGVIHGRTGQRWTWQREVSVPGRRETSHERWAVAGQRLRPT